MAVAFDPTELEDELQAEQVAQAAMEHFFPRLWAQRHMLNEKGQPIEFADRPGMQEIWDDLHPNSATQKPTQIGASLMLYTKAIHAAAEQGKVCIYTMPTDSDAGRLVKGRIDRVIERSPYLRKLTGRDPDARVKGQRRVADNTEMKEFGEGMIYFDGTKGQTGALSVPADQLYHDEVDHSDQETLEMYRRRTDALPASQRVTHQASTPTAEGIGINALFQDSTAAQWLVKCTHCRWEGPLDYELHTEGKLLYLKCPNAQCGKALDPSNGHWVEQNPGHWRHGYHIVRMMFARLGDEAFLADIHKEMDRSIYTWHAENMVLGVTSKQGVSSIDIELIKQIAFTETYAQQFAAEPGTGPYYMGIDQGDKLSIGIIRCDRKREGERTRLVHFEEYRDPSKADGGWERAAELMELFGIQLCVTDAGPDSASAHRFAKKFPGRVLCCRFAEGQPVEVRTPSDVEKRSSGDIRGRVDANERFDITVERTLALDNTSHELQKGLWMLPSPVHSIDMQSFLKQLSNNVRTPQLKPDGTSTFRWARKGGPNDYFFMCVYAKLARDEGMRLRRQSGAIPSSLLIASATPKRRT